MERTHRTVLLDDLLGRVQGAILARDTPLLQTTRRGGCSEVQQALHATTRGVY